MSVLTNDMNRAGNLIASHLSSLRCLEVRKIFLCHLMAFCFEEAAKGVKNNAELYLLFLKSKGFDTAEEYFDFLYEKRFPASTQN